MGTLPSHPHLTILHIVLDSVQSFLCRGDSKNLEVNVPEGDGVEGVVLPCDDDGSLVGWCAYFEADAIVREEDELGGVPDAEHLREIEEQGGNF